MDKILLQELKINKQFFEFLKLKKQFANQIIKPPTHQHNLYSNLIEINEILNHTFIYDALINIFPKFLETYTNTTINTFKEEAKRQKGYGNFNGNINFSNVMMTVTASILWKYTTQGQDFWKDIRLKWIQYITDNVVTEIAGKQLADEILNYYVQRHIRNKLT